MADNNKVDEFIIAVKLETDQLKQDFSKLNANFDKMGKDVKDKFDKIFSPNDLKKNLSKNEDLLKTYTLSFSKILTGGMIGLGTTLGVGFALDFIKGMTSQAHGMQTMSQAFGTTPRNLQLLQEVYKRAGDTPETANNQVAGLYQRLTDVSNPQGVAKLSRVLSGLGVSTQEVMSDPSTAILKILKKISQFKTPQERSTYLGLTGLTSLGTQALVNNPRNIGKYTKEVQGDLVSNEDITKQAELDKRFQDLGERWRKIQTTLLDDIIPGLEGLTNIVDKLLHPLDTIGKASAHGANFMPNIAGIMPVLNQNNVGIHTTPMPTLNSIWDKIKSGIAFAETSGGLPSQVRKADAMGAYGKYGLTLKTAREQLASEHNPMANTITADKLRANNYQLADEIAGRYFNRLNKAYGTEGAIKRYRGSNNNFTNEMYLQKVKQNSVSMQQSVPAQHSAINHNTSTSYNIDNIHLPNVNNPQQFVSELNMLQTTAFNSGRNQLA